MVEILAVNTSVKELIVDGMRCILRGSTSNPHSPFYLLISAIIVVCEIGDEELKIVCDIVSVCKQLEHLYLESKFTHPPFVALDCLTNPWCSSGNDFTDAGLDALVDVMIKTNTVKRLNIDRTTK